MFRDQYVTTEELCSYLQAADVFVSPYLNEAQVTSGALSYAMGAGSAVVSTPYWHAKELLAEGRGRLFPFGDSVGLANAIAALFDNPAELARVRAHGYEYTRAFTWSEVGRQYLRLGETLGRGDARVRRRRDEPRASSLPELRLDHLLRLTDDTGIIQHATFSVPARASGYCVDDNARALMVALHAEALSGAADTKRLISTYLAFLHGAQTSEGRFRNFMTYERSFTGAGSRTGGTESDDCTGRALWALGTTAHLSRDEGQRMLARQMFERGLPFATELGPRGTALTMLGLTAFLARHPEVGPAAELLARLAGRLCRRYRQEATTGWRWFEPALTYDNALLPLALWRAHALHAGFGEPRRRARVARLSRGHLLPGRSPRPHRERGLARARRDALRRRRAADRCRGVRARVPGRVPRDARSPVPSAHAAGVRLVSRRQPPGRRRLRLGDRGMPRRPR